MGCFQHLPFLRPGARDAKARYDRRPGLASDNQPGRPRLVSRRRFAAISQTPEGLSVNVRQEAKTRGNSSEFEGRIGKAICFGSLHVERAALSSAD